MSNLFANSKVEGVVSPEDLVQPELITITGNTDQIIQFDFKTNVSAPAQLQNTTRVDFCRNLPVTKPLQVTSSVFLVYDELCPKNTNYIELKIGNGIEKIDVDGKTVGLKLTLKPEDTKDLPNECAFALFMETTEFNKKMYAFGSLLIRHFAIPEP